MIRFEAIVIAWCWQSFRKVFGALIPQVDPGIVGKAEATKTSRLSDATDARRYGCEKATGQSSARHPRPRILITRLMTHAAGYHLIILP